MTPIMRSLEEFHPENDQQAVICFAPLWRCSACRHAVRLSYLREEARQTPFSVCPVCGQPYSLEGTPVADWLYEPRLKEVTDVRDWWVQLRQQVVEDTPPSSPLSYLERVVLHCRDKVFCQGPGHVHC